MMAGILPRTVRCVAIRSERKATLFATEEAVLAQAVPQRRSEFTTVRWCARRALADLGFDPAAIIPDQFGAPSWPAGVVGSMTHCPGYRAAAVARRIDMAVLGIDAEPNEPLPAGTAPLVATSAEFAALPRAANIAWDRVLFSAKEAIYKAWFPLGLRYLDFLDAEVQVDPAGTFRARLPAPNPRAPDVEVPGRWTIGAAGIATAVALDPDAAIAAQLLPAMTPGQ